MDLVILDELGYLPFSQAGGALLFHLLSKLYEHTSVMITTNLDFGEWGSVFGDAKMTTNGAAGPAHHQVLDAGRAEQWRTVQMALKKLFPPRRGCKGHFAHPDPDNRGTIGDAAAVHLVPDVDQAQIGAGAIGQRPRSSRTAMRGGRPRLSGQYLVSPAA
jgi:hypothetical protein